MSLDRFPFVEEYVPSK